MTRKRGRPRGGMRVVVLAGVLLGGAAAPAEEVAREAVPRGGPVSFWALDGSLEDAAGESRDNLVGRGAGGGTCAVRFVRAAELPGTVGKAVALGIVPGDALYLTAPSSPDVRLGPRYTIEAWIQPTGLGKWDRLVLCWGSGYAYHLAIHDGTLSLYHGQANGKHLFAEGGRIRTGRWYHVAGVARRNEAEPPKSRLEVYLNGRLTASAPFDGTIRVLPREGLGVGDSAGKLPGAHHFRGYIDELAVWNRALGPGDIRAHYEKRAALLRGLGLARRKAETDRRAGRFAGLRELGVEEVIFAERHPGRDASGHYYANFGYSCTDPDYWLHGRDGGRLSKLNVRTGEVTSLLDDPGGAVRDPQVHYDAKKILFSYRKGGSHNYNLHEISVESSVDGTGLRRITSGPWDDVEPTYLPDGGIVFCSTRCKRYIGCWFAPSAILFRCDADGGNIRMLSSGAFTENTPAVLPDGRVLYTRWEYVNRDPVVFHHLWTMNPDGTAQMVYFGNMHPGGVFIDAKPIPGTERVAFIHSPAHGRNEHTGRLAIVTDKHGPDAKSSMRHVTRANDFRDPWPLSEDAFLVARRNQILLVDSRGGAEVLHAASGMVHEPCPVIKRPRERTVPPRVDATKTTGVVILTDVYFGRNMGGIERGAIKKLLVLEQLPKPANFHGGGSQPIGHGVTSTLKRILGTVPVEPDGSAYFEVPAMRSVYFAALDANDLSVKQMRSFVTLQPGERVGCVGCHEERTATPLSGGRKLLALSRAPSRIEPAPDVPGVIDFPRDVQPVLDRHCVKCHNHEKRKGGVVLAGDRGPVFSHSYYTLLLHWQVKDTTGDPGNGSGRQKGNDKPYSAYSSASPLMKKIDGGHNKVRLTPRERNVVRLWLDTSAQYAGTYAAHGTGQVGGCWGNNKPVRVMADRWPSTGPARDAVGRRCVSCHGRMLPKHVTDRIPLSHGDMLSWERPLSRFSRHRVYNLSRPEKSLVLLVPLARASGGYAEGKPVRKQVREDRRRPPKPVVHPVIFADASDPDYVKILAHVRSAKAKLEEIKRFDMPGFRPNEHYVREMKRFGVLPASFDPARDPIDCYETDMKYWESFWCRAETGGGTTYGN